MTTDIETTKTPLDNLLAAIKDVEGGDKFLQEYESSDQYSCLGELFSGDLKVEGVTFIEGDTGQEGGGECCNGIIQVGDLFFEAGWSYYSYDGCDYDYIKNTIQQVTPKEVMKTIYVSVDSE